MAYDQDLANRIRELLADERGITEKAMFGGLAFLLRLDPAETDEALGRPHTEIVVMRGRQMPGWIRVAPDGVKTKRQLQPWVRRALGYTRTLPPKG